MPEKKSDSIFKRLIDVKNDAGNLKKQITIDLSPYDTSKMKDFKEGDKVYTGHTCQIRVCKFGQNAKESWVNIDPVDVNVRKAIEEMYSVFDKFKK